MLFDFEKIAPLDCYKLLASTIVPRPIAWVVTQDRQGVLNAAPFSFFNALSGDPPVIGIGIGARPAPGDAVVVKDTGLNIRNTGQFTVCLVGYDNAKAMNVTAIDFPPGVDELREAGLTTCPSIRVKPPRIAESPVAMECELMQMIDLGTERVLVLGRVLAMHVRDDCVLNPDKCYIDTPKLDLVGRMHGAGWYSRTTERFERPRISPDAWAAGKKGHAG